MITEFTASYRTTTPGSSPDSSGALYRRKVPPGVEVYEINGPFFFGAAESFKNAIRQVASKPKVLIIRMRNVPAMDATGLHALQTVVHQARKDGTRVILAEVHAQPMLALAGSDMLAELGGENLAASLDVALAMSGEPAAAAPPGDGRTTPPGA
jgi:SulP family sulfate permease